MAKFTFRKAEEKDIPEILYFIHQIAVYEKLEKQVKASEASLHKWMFERKVAECLFLVEDGKDIGYALYFFNFSTFEGRGGLYLEDLYILPEYRHKGYGKKTFRKLALIAKENGCGRMEWVCIDWNTPSQKFYESLGVTAKKEWILYRLEEKDIERIAEEEN